MRVSFPLPCLALLACSLLPGSAQPVYFTNLQTAFAFTSNTSRILIIYTGNSSHCSGETPRNYFDKKILQKYPQLSVRSNLYAVCEQFTYVPPKDDSNEINRAFFAAQREFDPLYSKYYIPTFFPTLTFVNPGGRLLNGPFWTLGYGDEFSGNIDNYYETMRDYLAAEQPMNRDKGRSNLVNAVFSTKMTNPVFGLFHCIYHTNDGPQELLLQDGAKSRHYEVGEQFQFTVRDLDREVRNAPPWGEHQYASLISGVGRFKDSEPFTGTFIVRLNGAWFKAWMNDSGKTLASGLTAGRLALKQGEHHFIISVLDDSVAIALEQQLGRLRPATPPPQLKWRDDQSR